MQAFKFKEIASDGTLSVSSGGEPEMTLELPAKYGALPVTRVGKEAFEDAPIYKLVIPEGIVHLEEYAFSGCKLLEEVVLPSTLRTIGTGCFGRCEHLTSIRLPENLAVIGFYAFSNCRALTEIEFPAGLKRLGWHVFDESGLRRAVFRGSLSALPQELFQNCNALETVVFPKDITRFEFQAFQNCTYISDMVVPNGVKVIGGWCFEGCLSLRRIVIPKSVRAIEYRAFADCPALEEAIFEEPNGWFIRDGTTSMKVPCEGFFRPDTAAKLLRNACERGFCRE